MRYLLSLCILSFPALGIDPILSLSPNIDKKYAKKIYSAVKKCPAVEKNIFIAILFKESSFEVNPKHTNPQDKGIGGLNMYWWKKPLNVEVSRLVSDVEYAIELSCEVLKEKRQHFKTDKYYWATYHSATKELKETYINSIKKLIEKIDGYKTRKRTTKISRPSLQKF